MRYLTLAEVLELHRQVIEQSGGASGVRDLGLLESAVAQPRMTFEKTDLYPTLEEKAAVLVFRWSTIILSLTATSCQEMGSDSRMRPFARFST